MSYTFNSRLGEQLYRLLPEVYRTRDKPSTQGAVNSGDESLARYLDSQGHLLDLIHATLEQQLKDVLPGSSQQWLLPYFAQLLAVNILSPDAAGKHAEVEHAIEWRQRKGTLLCVEEIASAIGQMEVEIQEGWKRVAMTPKIGMPVLPQQAWDNMLQLDLSNPAEAAQHPGLPAAMTDLRYASRAVKTPSSNPAARTSTFAGIKEIWRQVNYHGLPCFPGSFEDVSRRTVDFRSTDKTSGYYHPRRLLIYSPPPAGLFPLEPIELSWSELNDTQHRLYIEQKDENGVWVIRNNTNRIIQVSDDVLLSPIKHYRIEGLNFNQSLTAESGSTLELKNVEASRVQVDTALLDEASLVAHDCLFDELSVGNGLVELVRCTVLNQAFLLRVDIRDSILMQISDPEISGIIIYSRIPPEIQAGSNNRTVQDCVVDHPAFFNNQTILNALAVLAPNSPKVIYNGASNGREMGVFNQGRRARPVRIKGDFITVDALQLSTLDSQGFVLEDILFEGVVEVASGSIHLQRCAVNSLRVNTEFLLDSDSVVPVVDAVDCLFDQLVVTQGLARMEYSTVMQSVDCAYLQASDCIFAGVITNIKNPLTELGISGFQNCIRYSAIPADLELAVAQNLSLKKSAEPSSLRTNTTDKPVFIQFDYCSEGVHEHRLAVFGEAGFAVLDSITPDSIRFGAEDGGEMGVYHKQYHSLKNKAVVDKMREFLPVGIEPVMVQDTRLLHLPPSLIN